MKGQDEVKLMRKLEGGGGEVVKDDKDVHRLEKAIKNTVWEENVG